MGGFLENPRFIANATEKAQAENLDETVILLFEENEALKTSQNEQDDSIIALYESLGGKVL